MSPRSKLSAVAADVAESGWLAALLAVPVFFNVYTERVFEEDKALLLRAVAALLAAALVVRAGEHGRAVLQLDGRSILRHPVGIAVVAWTAVYALSSAFSIDPAVSWWGAYDRNHGFATWLALVMIFFAGAVGGDRRERLRRVSRGIDCLLITSAAVAAYALAQAFGLDPIEWRQAASATRPASTAGNPIFAAAFLIMAVPLTLARALAAIRVGAHLSAAAAVLLLLTQGSAIAVTQSRGPWLALAAALAVFLLLLAALQLRRSLLQALALLAAASVLAGGSLAYSPTVDATERQRDAHPASSNVRTLIWQTAADMIAAEPARLVLGSGPETFFVAYAPYYPAALGQYERRDVSPDRAHNQTLDALANTGVAGAIAELWLFVALFHLFLRRLGLVGGAGWRLPLFCGTGGFLGLLAPIVVDGSLRFIGLGIPIGVLAGLGVFAASQWPPRAADRRSQQETLLTIGMLAAVLAHFAEIQVGIPIVMTRLFLLALAAMAVALPAPTAVGEDHRGEGDAALQGIWVALVLLVLTFDAYTPTTDLGGKLAALACVPAIVWVLAGLGCLGATAAAAQRSTQPPALLRSFGIYTVMSIGPWLAFAAVYKPWIDWQPGAGGDALLPVAEQLAGATEILYAAVAVWIAFHALYLSFGRDEPAARLASIPGVVAVAGGVVFIWSCTAASFTATRADVLSKLGGILQGADNPRLATRAHMLAYEIRPTVGRYASHLAGSLVEQARGESGESASVALLARAENLLTEAAARQPLDADYLINLARLYRLWGSRVAAGEQARLFDRAAAAYSVALAMWPQRVLWWNELATLYAQRGDRRRATETFEHALSLDDQCAATYWTRAEVAYDGGDFKAALRDYEAAVSLRPSAVEAWAGKAAALARLGLYEEAIAAAREALDLDPGDPVKHRNLALLHRASGDPTTALTYAERAADLSGPGSRSRHLRLIEEIRAERAASAGAAQ